MRIAPEGKIIIQPLAIMTFLSVGYEMMTNGSFIISIILTTVILFCINFFRDPIRNPPDEKNIMGGFRVMELGIILYGTCVLADTHPSQGFPTTETLTLQHNDIVINTESRNL